MNIITQYKKERNTAEKSRSMVSLRISRDLIDVIDERCENRSEAIRKAVKKEYESELDA